MKKLFIIIIICALACLTLNRCTNSVALNNSPVPIFKVTKIKVGKAPGSVEATDLNGDKITDLLVANMDDNSVTVLLGTGNRKFAQAKGSPFKAGPFPNDIAITDFNHDGKADIAFANHEHKYLTVLLGDGKGGFAPMTGSPFHVQVKPHTHGVVAADFNGDGYPDLVTDSWGNNRLEVLFANAHKGFDTTGKFIDVGKHPYQRIRAADLDKNGTMDLVTTNLDGNNATILLGDGKGNFHEPVGSPFACGDSPFGVAIGDINGDGNLDLAIVNSPSITSENRGRDGLTILLGNGRGKFTKMQGSPFTTGKSPSRVAIGDINGDGNPDIAVTNYNDNSISVFFMKEGNVSKTTTLKVGRKPDGITIASIYGNSKGTIVVSCGDDNEITLLTM
jgi:FG-GAP-like repeat